MNINFVLVLTCCIVVVLKLLGYIALGWTPILWGVGIVFGFILLTLLLAVILASTTTEHILNRKRR